MQVYRHSYTPVSYTHLDVYKRQIRKRAFDRVTSLQHHNVRCQELSETGIPSGREVHVREGVGVVIDVYKRQRFS